MSRWSLIHEMLSGNVINGKRSRKMGKAKMPHEGHEEHLCYLHNTGYLEKHLEDYMGLVVNARFVCRKCGRAATNDSNLCQPERI
jgi:hypothetical protein